MSLPLGFPSSATLCSAFLSAMRTVVESRAKQPWPVLDAGGDIGGEGAGHALVERVIDEGRVVTEDVAAATGAPTAAGNATSSPPSSTRSPNSPA